MHGRRSGASGRDPAGARRPEVSGCGPGCDRRGPGGRSASPGRRRSRSRRSRSACPAVSTPSAVTVRSSACASETSEARIRSSVRPTAGDRRPATNSPATFSSVTGRSPQVRQVGVAGAEVVDGDAYPEVGQDPQGAHRLLGGAHHRALGDLQLQPLRRQAGLPQHARTSSHQPGSVHLADGQVDADEGAVGASRPTRPRPRRHASSSTHPPSGTIRPVSSARPMKLSGASTPAPGAASGPAPPRRPGCRRAVRTSGW